MYLVRILLVLWHLEYRTILDLVRTYVHKLLFVLRTSKVTTKVIVVLSCYETSSSFSVEEQQTRGGIKPQFCDYPAEGPVLIYIRALLLYE